MEIARPKDLVVIEDAAQAPGVRYKERYTGGIGDIGCFSLNYHKHIHTGEGGVVPSPITMNLLCVHDSSVIMERTPIRPMV